MGNDRSNCLVGNFDSSHAGDMVGYTEDDLKEALPYTALARTTGREIGRASRRYWLLRYLEGKAGGEAEAVVLTPLGNGCRLELTETRLTAFCAVRTTTSPAPGARVRVRLTKVCARSNVIRVELER